MSDPREQLKAMLQDLINDRPEQAEVTIHDYIVAKTQQIAGLGATPAVVEEPTEPTAD
jgi:hypothetical protein